MVSKVAVIALVAIVAVPILMGYGLNVQTEQIEKWEQDGNALDMTSWLVSTYDSANTTYVDADIYKLNSNVFYRESYFDQSMNTHHLLEYPEYESTTSTVSSLSMTQNTATETNSSWHQVVDTTINHYQLITDGDYSPGNGLEVKFTYLDATIGQLSASLYYIKALTWKLDDSGNTGTLIVDRSELPLTSPDGYEFVNVVSVEIQAVGTVSYSYGYDAAGSYVDFSKGFRLNTDYPISTSYPLTKPIIYLDITSLVRSVLITFDLNSITDPDYVFSMSTDSGSVLQLKKETVGGEVIWSNYMMYIHPVTHDYAWHWQQLYYNPSATSNTYQLFINGSVSGELRYVGAWPDTIGAAPTLLKYDIIIPDDFNPDNDDIIGNVSFKGQSPLMRIDNARVAGYNYLVMKDGLYDPSVFKANPATKISDIFTYGNSITFGGTTYQVTKSGNLVIGTKEISLNNMVFDSVSTGLGTYDNRINGNTVSTTATPSTIAFNGSWSMKIVTAAQKQTTTTATHWIPGQFAWNGVDTDFKLVGLLTCLGAFIGLGIYAKSKRASILPLIIVCGCAAFMFLLLM